MGCGASKSQQAQVHVVTASSAARQAEIDAACANAVTSLQECIDHFQRIQVAADAFLNHKCHEDFKNAIQGVADNAAKDAEEFLQGMADIETRALALPQHTPPGAVELEPVAGVTPMLATPAAPLLLELPRASTDVTQRGVTLHFLSQLVESGEVDGAWTIQQTVERFVRPKTLATLCCLHDVIPAASVGRPRFFISHTWSNRLSDLLQLLKAHFKWECAAEVIVWLDIVAINQHPYEDKGCLLNDDVANLAKVVAATERTLLCLDPSCAALSRIWCIFEVWQTLSAKDVAGLLVLTHDVDARKLREVVDSIDVMKAKATQAADRERILAEIASSLDPAVPRSRHDVDAALPQQSLAGANLLNLQIKRALMDGVTHEARSELFNKLSCAITATSIQGLEEEIQACGDNAEKKAALVSTSKADDGYHPPAVRAVASLSPLVEALGKHMRQLEPLRKQLDCMRK